MGFLEMFLVGWRNRGKAGLPVVILPSSFYAETTNRPVASKMLIHKGLTVARNVYIHPPRVHISPTSDKDLISTLAFPFHEDFSLMLLSLGCGVKSQNRKQTNKKSHVFQILLVMEPATLSFKMMTTQDTILLKNRLRVH